MGITAGLSMPERDLADILRRRTVPYLLQCRLSDLTEYGSALDTRPTLRVIVRSTVGFADAACQGSGIGKKNVVQPA